jgi:hypothetical protein
MTKVSSAACLLTQTFSAPSTIPTRQSRVRLSLLARERAESEITWREVFHNGSQQTFRRILLGAGMSFMQQMCGVNVVAYYP